VNPSAEYEFEAAPGLPEKLPNGEHIIWQGAPDWKQLALQAFHVRIVSIYFALMLAIQLFNAWDSGQPLATWVGSLLTSLGLSLCALALLAGCAWLSSRETLYTITNKRVVMRIGIVLTVTFNLPFARITGASVKALKGSTGDLALALNHEDQIGYFHLMPHARPWHLRQPQPALRCIPEVAKVGALLQQAWQAANPQARAVAHEAMTQDTCAPATPTGWITANT
jgi:hypothetical protein